MVGFNVPCQSFSNVTTVLAKLYVTVYLKMNSGEILGARLFLGKEML